MSVFSPAKPTNKQKVHYSQYIKSEDTPKEPAAKPDEQPEKPDHPEAS